MTLRILYVLVNLANLGDDITTYIALTSTVQLGFFIEEANPIARWLFDTMGLAQGLVFETVIMVAISTWLLLVKNLPYKLKFGVFAILLTMTVAAFVNNVWVLSTKGFV